MSDTPPPPAGWYADPENAAGERWWNGSGWSEHRRDPSAPATTDGRPDPYAAAAAPAWTAPPGVYQPPGGTYVAPYGAPTPGSGVNGLALAGLLVGAIGWLIFGVIGGIAGTILSGFGLAQARKREAAGSASPGRGLAIAGLAVSIAVTVIGGLIVVSSFALLFSDLSP